MLRKQTWLLAMLLTTAMLLAACPAAAPAAPAATEESAAAATEAPAEEETTEEAAATEEPAEEVASAEGVCAPATEGELTGIDPSGETVVWWHNHTGVRQERLQVIVDEFNETNECGIFVDAQSQGSYGDIRDKVNAGIAGHC